MHHRYPTPARGLCVLPASLLLIAVSSLGAAEDAKGLSPEDVAKLRVVSSCRMSPGGTHVAYTLVVPRDPLEEPSGRAHAELHVVLPNGVSRPYMTGDVRVHGLEWTPDGRSLSFLAARDGDEHAALWVIPVDGGEARKVLEHPTGIQSYVWSPDGGRVAFIAPDEQPEEEKELEEKGFDQRIYEEDFEPVRVRIAEPDPEEPATESRALDLPGTPSELHWSPDGSRLAVALAPTPLVDDHYMERRVRIVDVESGEIVREIDNPGKLGEIAWSPDASRIAYITAQDRNDPNAGRLAVAGSQEGAPSRIELGVEGDYDDIAWKDEDTIVYLASVGVHTRLGEVSVSTGEHRIRVHESDGMVLTGLSLAAGARSLAVRSHSARHPHEVFTLGPGAVAPRRLTDSNPWLEERRLAPQEVVTWKSRDGLELQGMLIRPLDAGEGERHPLILTVHGGPEAHQHDGWLTWYSYPGQVAAARGFAVFYPNYRGSTGRGVEFSKLGQADYAGGEFDDLVDAVDHLVKTGVSDRKRVGITGGSYGGFATAWCSTYHTKHFAAGVMFVGISDQISKYGTTDIPDEMYLVHARKKLYGNWQWFLERSPIYHAEKARTPLLILHGEEDTRVHPSQSLEMYRHLKNLGQTPVRLVLYPGEGHGNRRSAARYDYSLRMLRWFEHYLQGEGGEPPASPVEYRPDLEEEEEKDGEDGDDG